MKQTLMSKGHR